MNHLGQKHIMFRSLGQKLPLVKIFGQKHVNNNKRNNLQNKQQEEEKKHYSPLERR